MAEPDDEIEQPNALAMMFAGQMLAAEAAMNAIIEVAELDREKIIAKLRSRSEQLDATVRQPLELLIEALAPQR